MAIRREIVKAHGANAAIVHQQVQWAIDYELATKTAHIPGWFTGTSEELSQLSGLSPDQCRRAMSKLLEADLMEKRKARAKQGDQTCSYRPKDPTVSAVGDSAISGDRDSAGSGDGDIAGSSSSSESKSNTSPSPPEEGESEDGDQPSLFAPGRGGGATTNAELRKRAHRRSPAGAAGREFEVWWERYPEGVRGSKQTAARRYQQRRAEGISPGEIAERLDRYHLARSVYAEEFGKPPSLMRASSFLNGKFELWDHEWTQEEIEDYWPPPPGRSWGGLDMAAAAAKVAKLRG